MEVLKNLAGLLNCDITSDEQIALIVAISKLRQSAVRTVNYRTKADVRETISTLTLIRRYVSLLLQGDISKKTKLMVERLCSNLDFNINFLKENGDDAIRKSKEYREKKEAGNATEDEISGGEEEPGTARSAASTQRKSRNESRGRGKRSSSKPASRELSKKPSERERSSSRPRAPISRKEIQEESKEQIDEKPKKVPKRRDESENSNLKYTDKAGNEIQDLIDGLASKTKKTLDKTEDTKKSDVVLLGKSSSKKQKVEVDSDDS